MQTALFPELVVNGETVPRAAIAAEAQNHAAPKGKPGIAWRKAANALALRTLLLQEARRRGFRPEPAELGPGRFETGDEALIRTLLEAAIEVEAPSEDAVRAEWARDPARFRAPPLWEVSHILIACDPRDKAETAAARMRALDLAGRALADPRGFSRLAAAHSDCGSKATGGTLGQIGPGDTVPEFETALASLSEGEVTADPVLTRHGWHVIRLDGRADGAPLPFETVRPKIAAAMEKAAWARAARDFVNGLIAAAKVSGADFRTA
ncbi:peptidylprolyl isomerase [Paracoccus sp. (in: a-proteobacteria)]|uniref:peptidylprolyl isomerase n=1 Tax=Paracoccus sp. TaxID=267 RepID=UPI003A89FE26